MDILLAMENAKTTEDRFYKVPWQALLARGVSWILRRKLSSFPEATKRDGSKHRSTQDCTYNQQLVMPKDDMLLGTTTKTKHHSLTYYLWNKTLSAAAEVLLTAGKGTETVLRSLCTFQIF
jgi:hypothetical protein